ncbi:unnamed protein product, partial [Amoebophrya sp. A25]
LPCDRGHRVSTSDRSGSPCAEVRSRRKASGTRSSRFLFYGISVCHSDRLSTPSGIE